MSGNATHTMDVHESTNIVQFDIWDLEIYGVWNATNASQTYNWTVA